MDLFDFVKLTERDLAIQQEISSCQNSADLEKILEKYRCEFTIKNIENISIDLAANYWPWSGKTKLERKIFFTIQ